MNECLREGPEVGAASPQSGPQSSQWDPQTSVTGTSWELVRNTEPRPLFFLSQNEQLRDPQVNPVLIKM